MKGPKSLRSYLVDRGNGVTASGGVGEVIVLVLRTDDMSEVSVCMSKVDAVILADQLRTMAVIK